MLECAIVGTIVGERQPKHIYLSRSLSPSSSSSLLPFSHSLLCFLVLPLSSLLRSVFLPIPGSSKGKKERSKQKKEGTQRGTTKGNGICKTEGGLSLPHVVATDHHAPFLGLFDWAELGLAGLCSLVWMARSAG